MRLFEIVPANFFSILASGNREIYYNALMLLHESFQTELNIRLDDFRSALIAHLEDEVFELEEDDRVEGSLTPTNKATILINKLIKTGWVEKEYLDSSFIEILTPKNYAIPMMKLLSELGDTSLQEYNSLVFSTYSALQLASKRENYDQMYEAVLAARKNTEQLSDMLRTFYHSIRGFTRALVDQGDVNELLKNHFGEFIELSDRIYHPIKTMDSFYRYQSPIQSMLTGIYANESMLNAMRKRAMSVKKHADQEEADHEIFAAIDYTLDAYRSLGGIINEIDKKKSVYTKSTSEKIRYLLSADQTIKSKLAEILKSYANADEDGKETIQALLERHIEANRQEVFDSAALFHRSIRSKRVDKDPVEIVENKSLDGVAEEYLLAQIKNGFPLKRIRAFIDGLFADGQTSVTTADIHLESDTDFILLMLAVIRQHDVGMGYHIDIEDTRTDLGGYIVPDMTITRKKATNHVE
jgi:F0F1-type ATP synthase delta subunit